MSLVNPFRNIRPDIAQPDLDDPKVARVVSMEVDKDTLMVSPVFEFVDTQKEIEACKELCGLDYMKKLLASGQITAEELQDNAGAEFDATVYPETVHDAKREADQLNAEIGKAISSAGGKEGKVYTAEEVEDLIKSAVAAKFEEAKAAQAAQATQKAGDIQ